MIEYLITFPRLFVILNIFRHITYSHRVCWLWSLSWIIKVFVKIVKISHPIDVGLSLFQVSNLDFLLISSGFVFSLDGNESFLFKILCETLSFALMGGDNAVDHLMVQLHSLVMGLLDGFRNMAPLLNNFWNIFMNEILHKFGFLSIFYTLLNLTLLCKEHRSIDISFDLSPLVPDLHKLCLRFHELVLATFPQL